MEPKTKIIYKEESYKILGCCFEVFNNIGFGHREFTYQKALKKLFADQKVIFESQLCVPVKINNEIVTNYFLDFLISDKIAVELKAGDHFHRKDIEQLYSYLKSKNLQLGLLINFTSGGVICKRILNIK